MKDKIKNVETLKKLIKIAENNNDFKKAKKLKEKLRKMKINE